MKTGVLEATLRRERAVVVACLAALALLAWAYLLWLTRAMPAAGHPHAWSLAYAGYMFVMWAVMMVGMMVPSAAPMILVYARVARQAAGGAKPLTATGFFASGYLLAWTLFSLAATAGQWLLARGLLLTPMMASASAALSAIVLIAAGGFQFSRLKRACLHRCQAPLAFIQHHGGFRATPRGAVAIGFRHGLYCVGCCWALMALLFVGGVMNLLLIAVLSAFVLAEKAMPAARWLQPGAGILLVAWGVWILAAAA